MKGRVSLPNPRETKMVIKKNINCYQQIQYYDKNEKTPRQNWLKRKKMTNPIPFEMELVLEILPQRKALTYIVSLYQILNNINFS